MIGQNIGKEIGENLDNPDIKDKGISILSSLLGMLGGANEVVPSNTQGANKYMIEAADKELKKHFSEQAKLALNEPGGMESLMAHASLKDQENTTPGANAINVGNGSYQLPNQAQPNMPQINPTASPQQGSVNGAQPGLNQPMQGISAMDILKGILPFPFAMPEMVKNKLAQGYGETPEGRLRFNVAQAEQVPMAKAEKSKMALEMQGSLPANQIAATEALAKLIPAIQATMTPVEKAQMAIGIMPPQIQNIKQQLGGVQEGRKIVGGAASKIGSALQGKIESIKSLRQEGLSKAGKTSYGMGWKIEGK